MAQATEPMRVDAHQHFWRYSEEEYGWINDLSDVVAKPRCSGPAASVHRYWMWPEPPIPLTRHKPSVKDVVLANRDRFQRSHASPQQSG